MNTTNPKHSKLVTPHRLFKLFKYTIYILLAYEIFLWFQEDLIASAETFGDTVTWRNVVEAYSATIDTAAWVVLLLMFELETAVISDEKLQGGLKWFFTGIVAVCYVLITWAFYGYVAKYGVFTDVVPFSIGDVCSLMGTDWNYILDLDDYPPHRQHILPRLAGAGIVPGFRPRDYWHCRKSEVSCGSGYHRYHQCGHLADHRRAAASRSLASTQGHAHRSPDADCQNFQGILLFGAVVCAAYWGFNGTFLDFWDAFLWLVAFIFIELNIFQWHEEE